MSALVTEQKMELAPQSEASKAGEALLRQILGSTTTIPTQGTAGLSPIQQLIQQYMPGMLGNINAAGNQATNQYANVLTGDYNPATDPLYQTTKEQAQRSQKEGVTALRRQAEAGGMLGSSNAAGVEAGFRQQSNSALLQQLNQLLENQKNMKLQAAQALPAAEAQKIGNVASAYEISDIQRQIEQQQADAIFQQAMLQALFPYTYQANLMNTLMNYSPGIAVTGGEPTDLGFQLNVASEGYNTFQSAGG
jgi:hypothetical protein